MTRRVQRSYDGVDCSLEQRVTINSVECWAAQISGSDVYRVAMIFVHEPRALTHQSRWLEWLLPSNEGDARGVSSLKEEAAAVIEQC